MAAGQLRGDDYTLTVEQPAVPYVSRGHHDPRKGWKYTDENGHVHQFEGRELPTLEWTVTGTYWCGSCNDEHEEGEYRCRGCGAVVEPKYDWIDTSMVTQYMPGLTEVKVVFDDGRGYFLRPDEQTLVVSAGRVRLSDDALGRVAGREPDWYEIVGGRIA